MAIRTGRFIVLYRSCARLINGRCVKQASIIAKAALLALLILGAIYPVASVAFAQTQAPSTAIEQLVATLCAGIKVALAVLG